MNLRDLEYIVTVGKHRSFSYAALVCHVSQPSLSTQIKKVEEKLGIPIFKRNRRKVEITAFGLEFIERAEVILSLLDEIQELADTKNEKLKGQVVLGAILTVAPYVLTHVTKAITEQAPSINLVLKESKTETLIKELLEGKVDAAIVSLPSDEHVFDSLSLFTEPFYLAMPQGHPFASKAQINDKDLSSLKLILLEEGHCFRNQALDICKKTTASENTMFQATSLETIREFVASGNGITLMPAVAVKENDGIIYRPLANPSFSRSIGLIWRRTKSKQTLITRLAEITRDTLDTSLEVK